MLHGTHLLLGSVLSPFALKVRLLCEHAGLPIQWLPENGSTWLNLQVQARRLALVHGVHKLTYPPRTKLGELPLVPFLFGPSGEAYYDSSAIGRLLHAQPPLRPAVALLPLAPVPRWVCLLIDEAFDELGLYLLHHQRWVRSARTTRAPEIVGREYAPLVPAPFRKMAQERFAARQVRRLPYLFSVAPTGQGEVTSSRQPPARPGFPPTHALLEALFVRWLTALDESLQHSPFLFGEAFTLADAAVYGMVASHLAVDPDTAAWLDTRTPSVARWARALTRGASQKARHEPMPDTIPPALLPLLQAIADSFVPLMLQNEAAYERLQERGQRRFNESAFNAGEALYDGVLIGHPYRSVVKTFQVEVWRALRSELQALDTTSRLVVSGLAKRLDELTATVRP